MAKHPAARTMPDSSGPDMVLILLGAAEGYLNQSRSPTRCSGHRKCRGPATLLFYLRARQDYELLLQAYLK